jgi:hypothetical protein
VPVIALVYGSVLIAIGVGGYILVDMQSTEALIPAFFGTPVLVLGVLALRENVSRRAVALVAVIAGCAFLGTAQGLPILVRDLRGQDLAPELSDPDRRSILNASQEDLASIVDRRRATGRAMSAMALASLGYLIVFGRSMARGSDTGPGAGNLPAQASQDSPSPSEAP